jgi:hypothetical protein
MGEEKPILIIYISDFHFSREISGSHGEYEKDSLLGNESP